MATITMSEEYEGALEINPCTTIEIYKSIKEEMYHKQHEGIFYAFDEKGFNEGYERVKHLLKEGEKVVRFTGGGFGVRAYIDKMLEYYDECDARIANECEPQEVYVYEYNNHECMYAYEGDVEAVNCVIRIFGNDAARKLQRRSSCYSVDTIIAMRESIKDVPELYYINDEGKKETPERVYFSYEDGSAFTHTGGKLHPIMQASGERYIAPSDAYKRLEGTYNKEKCIIYNLCFE